MLVARPLAPPEACYIMREGRLDPVNPPATTSAFVSPFGNYSHLPPLSETKEEVQPAPHILTYLPPEQQSTATKLEFVVAALGSQFQPGSLGLVQVWTSRLGRKWSGVSRQHANKTVLDTHLNACVVDNPRLQDFRDQSCQHGITGQGLGMLGKVWSSGALQVVQQVGIIPHSVHPRNKLKGVPLSGTGDSLDAVSEVVYIPIYVQSAPEAGVQAVVEVVVSSSVREAMVVANLISFLNDTLADLKVLSLAIAALHTSAVKLSLFKPDRVLPPRTSEGATTSIPPFSTSDEDAPAPPRRSMSRSGSSRVLSSYGELSAAVEKAVDRPPRASRAGAEAAAAKTAAERTASAWGEKHDVPPAGQLGNLSLQ